MYSKSVTSTDRQRNRARTALIRFASGPGITIARMRQLFLRTMCLSPRKAALMQRFGIVRPIGMDIAATVKRALPDLDLSPEAFDAALGERTRAVTYRDARIFVNLLDTEAERMIALRQATPEDDVLDWLVDRFAGRQVVAIDVGAAPGSCTLALARAAAPRIDPSRRRGGRGPGGPSGAHSSCQWLRPCSPAHLRARARGGPSSLDGGGGYRPRRSRPGAF